LIKREKKQKQQKTQGIQRAEYQKLFSEGNRYSRREERVCIFTYFFGQNIRIFSAKKPWGGRSTELTGNPKKKNLFDDF